MKTNDDLLYDTIVDMYHGLCIICLRQYNSIHEIIPKSLTRNWNVIENRVTLCIKHHSWAHERGTKFSAPKLREYQEKRLKQFHGSDNR